MEEDKEMLKLLHDIEGGRVGVEEVDEETATRFLQFMKEHIKNKMEDIKKINKEIEAFEEETAAVNSEIKRITRETEAIEAENKELDEKMGKIKKMTELYNKKVDELVGDIEDLDEDEE